MNPAIAGRPHAQTHTRPTRLNSFLFGAPYYPEHWDRSMWEEDARRMAEARFNIVRMAEFAWDLMEPRPGDYDWSVFEEVAALMGRHGIRTMLCTPTATPPRWLTYQHPEILRAMPNGLRCMHGSRQHACYASPLFREHSRRISRAMAEHFADNPNVIGWQTDNEINCGFSECVCPNCQQEYRLYLRDKYGSIEALNKAWGTAFWAQTYGDFDEIDLPLESRPGGENPSARLDYFRYLSHIAVRFQHDQVQELRAVNPAWLVMHNGIFQHLDYWTFSQDLDFLGYDCYPGFTVPNAPTPADGAAYVASRLDTARSYSGNFIVPEQQSGPGGQKGYLHPTPRPGEMRLWSYQSMAHGADGVMHFRWRTCRFGAEEYWCGILDHDNVPRRRYQEARQEGIEFAALSDKVLGTHVHMDVGILHTPEQDDAHQTLPHGLPAPSWAATHLHRALWMDKYAVGYINPSDRYDGVKMLVWPHMVTVDDAMADKLAAYVADGGILVIGGRSAIKNTDNVVLAETPPGPLQKLAGVTVEEYGMRPERYGYGITLGSEAYPAVQWYDMLQPTTARVIGTWSAGHLEGLPAVTVNDYGRGKVIYVGTYIAPETAPWIARLIADEAGLAPLLRDVPPAVEVVMRRSAERDLLFLLNHDETGHTLQDLPAGTDLLQAKAVRGELHLEPRQVAVIELKKLER